MADRPGLWCLRSQERQPATSAKGSCSKMPTTVASFLFSLMLWAAILDCSSAQTANPPVCMVKGRIYTEKDWYGYLLQKPFHRDWAKIQYQISYPVKECCVNLLIYYDDQLKQLNEGNTCKERVGILPSDNNQVIPLFSTNRTVGCSVWNNTGEPYYVCLGERIFRSSGPRTWYFALSRCGSTTPLNLNYVFNISGYDGECESDALTQSCLAPSPAPDKFLYVAVGLGVVAGIGLILASVFFTLWLQDKRRTKSKGSSVTSSQATMTQDDVFYVNPSLSDREQTDYSQTSSENYYEVIPERRSYESINTHLAVPGHPAHGRHATHLKDMRPFHPTLVFDDYPPPPYQPPRGMGVPRHHTLHHPPHHHHHHFLHAHGHPHANHAPNAAAANAAAPGNITLQQLQQQLQGQGQMQGQGQSHSMSAFGPASNLGPLRERAAAATHTETSA